MNQHEEWRTLDWAPNYEFSSFGKVRRTADAPGTFAGKILSQSIANGYRQLNLSLPHKVVTKKVHRLICEAFHGPPPSLLHQTAHTNGDRLNNYATNLRWVLPAENAADNLINGVRMMGENHPLSLLSEADVAEIRGAHASMIRHFSDKFSITSGHVRNIIAGKTWAVRRLQAQLEPTKAD